MKKQCYFFLLVIMALLFFSCEEKENVITQEEPVKIFVSVPQSEDLKDESKSYSAEPATTEKIEIANGDTVSIHARDLNSFMWAENYFGEAIKGSWRAELLETDYSSAVPNYPLDRIFVHSGSNYVSQISFKFPEFGLYKISAGKFQDRYNRTGFYTEVTFYVKVVGIPGLVGDNFRNKYIFRMEKKHLIKSFVSENVFVIYYKYHGDFKGHYCWLENINNYPTIKRTEVKMKKWPYSRPGDDYQYAVIKGLSGTYVLDFVGTDDQCNGINCAFSDQNAIESSWWNDNGGIIISIP
jgi:hypothetical protein